MINIIILTTNILNKVLFLYTNIFYLRRYFKLIIYKDIDDLKYQYFIFIGNKIK